MRWVRSNRRSGGLLAFAALALQLVLSFGHVHLDAVSRSPVVGAVAGVQGAPSLPDQHRGGDDYCAVCATIQLAANAFVPQAPQLAVPFVSRAIEHVDLVAVISIASRRAPFQPRAPPLA
jgi:hypothetical protein